MRTRKRFGRHVVLSGLVVGALGLGLGLPTATPARAAVESVSPTTASAGEQITVVGEDLPRVGDGAVLLHDDAGLGAVCTIESSDGSQLTCRLGAVGDDFVGRVTAVHGQWHDLGTDVVDGALGTWTVDTTFFLAAGCGGGPGGGSDSDTGVVVAVGSGGGVSASVALPWMRIDLPGDTTIGIDHVLQPGDGCGGGGGSQRPMILAHWLTLEGIEITSTVADPTRLAEDLALALEPSSTPFGITLSSDGPELWLEVPQATEADFLVLSPR